MLLEVLLDIGHRINLSCTKSDTALKETTNAFCFFFFFAVMPSLMCSFCHTRRVSCVKVWLHASTVKCNAGNHFGITSPLGFLLLFLFMVTYWPAVGRNFDASFVTSVFADSHTLLFSE